MHRYVDPDRALSEVLSHCEPSAPETVPLRTALARVLAQDVLADRDYPPFDRAMMDGFAVRLADAGRQVQVVGEVAAGSRAQQAVAPGSALAIMTGAPCPDGTEAVVPVEQVQRQGDAVLLPDELQPGQHIVPRGQEAAAGQRIIAAGARVGPLTVGALASVGLQQVAVRRLPSLCVVSTGDELVGPDQAPAAHQIRNSNGPMLAAAARAVGLGQVAVRHARDTVDSLVREVEAGGADITVLSGGVSAGRYDLVPEALSRLGMEAVFHKVSQRPGKPLLFGRLGQRLFFGLPGNPLSSHFCFVRYVVAAVRAITGQPQPVAQAGVLAEPLETACRRTRFVPARLLGPAPGGWQVAPMAVGSGNVFGAALADSYIRLEPGTHRLAQGESVRLEPC